MTDQNPNSILLILGNQLFPPQLLEPYSKATVYMAEDFGLCTYVRHHQQKLVLFLAAMRVYADELDRRGFTVDYYRLDERDSEDYESRLLKTIHQRSAKTLIHFEIEDKFMEQRIIALTTDNDILRDEITSPMFVCDRSSFAEYVSRGSRLLMSNFYKEQRRRLGVMVDDDGNPVGGKWSFDEENRKNLPSSIDVPDMGETGTNDHVRAVIELVADRFSDHPGNARQFWWPTTRRQALAWLNKFLKERLALFGPYEDAMTTRSATVFHSALSPVINLGLITPAEIVEKTVAYASENDVRISSLEGFIRQIIGWREFIRGVYQNFGGQQSEKNFWNHKRNFTSHWYDATTGIVPLDDAIRTATELGWTHHIYRLMVLGNLMTLCEIAPRHVHQWFMEMFVDSSDWVMGPNVYGMGLFSDGGLFASKPYICGSNYMLKMSDYKKGDWCETVDGLYWRFVDKHSEYFDSNPRVSFMTRNLKRMDQDRRDRIFAQAEQFLNRCTQTC